VGLGWWIASMIAWSTLEISRAKKREKELERMRRKEYIRKKKQETSSDIKIRIFLWLILGAFVVFLSPVIFGAVLVYSIVFAFSEARKHQRSLQNVRMR
jgi:uncharacterized membrane protein